MTVSRFIDSLTITYNIVVTIPMKLILKCVFCFWLFSLILASGSLRWMNVILEVFFAAFSAIGWVFSILPDIYKSNEESI